MTRRISAIFETKEAQRARVEAEIVARSERFRASPTVTIGSVTVANPVGSFFSSSNSSLSNTLLKTYDGPNPYPTPEPSEPDDEPLATGSQPDLLEAVGRRHQKRRARAKSEAYPKTIWPFDVRDNSSGRNPRYSAPPLTGHLLCAGDTDSDPFRKDPLSVSTPATNSFSLEKKKEQQSKMAFELLDSCVALSFAGDYYEEASDSAAAIVDYLQVEIPDNRIVL